jgi:hypothetical protein
MIKNTDKIAEKAANEQIAKDKEKKDAEDKIKTIQAAKSKMTEALNKSTKTKKEEKVKEKVAVPVPSKNPPSASTNTTIKE